MRAKQTDRRKPTLKRETIRRLEERALRPDDLQQVAGGIVQLNFVKTAGCPTWV